MSCTDVKQIKHIKIINIGLQSFYNSLKGQQVEVVQINWVPPVKVSQDLESILDNLL